MIRTLIFLIALCACQSCQPTTIRGECLRDVIDNLVNQDGYSIFRVPGDLYGISKDVWKIGLVNVYLEADTPRSPYPIVDEEMAISDIDIAKVSHSLENIELYPIKPAYFTQITKSKRMLKEALHENDLDVILVLYRVSSDKNEHIIRSCTIWTGNTLLVEHTIECDLLRSQILDSDIIDDHTLN